MPTAARVASACEVRATASATASGQWNQKLARKIGRALAPDFRGPHAPTVAARSHSQPELSARELTLDRVSFVPWRRARGRATCGLRCFALSLVPRRVLTGSPRAHGGPGCFLATVHQPLAAREQRHPLRCYWVACTMCSSRTILAMICM